MSQQRTPGLLNRTRQGVYIPRLESTLFGCILGHFLVFLCDVCHSGDSWVLFDPCFIYGGLFIAGGYQGRRRLLLCRPLRGAAVGWLGAAGTAPLLMLLEPPCGGLLFPPFLRAAGAALMVFPRSAVWPMLMIGLPVAGDKNFGRAGKYGGMGGKYGRKAEDLSQRQLKAAGAAKAAAKRTVSISDTKRDFAKGVTLGPKGKPLTGTVTLENGARAVYKDGKRVTAVPKQKPKAAASPAARPSSGGSSAAPSKPRPKPKAKDALKLGKGDTVRTSASRDAARAAGPRQTGQASPSKGQSASGARYAAAAASPSRGAQPRPAPPGRDTGNHKPTFYANGTARVWDAKQRKFVTVGKSDPRYPKR